MLFKKKKKREAERAISKYDNVSYNKKLWDEYSDKWSKQEAFIEDEDVSENEKENYIEVLGDEWGDKKSVNQVVSDFIFPYLGNKKSVAEIGSGGGRIAKKVSTKVGSLTCFDISENMIASAKRNLHKQKNIEFYLTDGKNFPSGFKKYFDFVYSFDVFVHLDLHTIWNYLIQIKEILKSEGLLFIHVSNLKAPEGWTRFCSQTEYKVEGHYFIIPEVVKLLAEKANYNIVKESKVDLENFYYKRDYMAILKSNDAE